MEQQYLGKLCPYSKTCPVYRGTLVVDRISPFLIKNVFCNRGQKGWYNCERFKMKEEGMEIPSTATPYRQR